MGKTCRHLFILALIVPLSACQSFSIDKERATERRKQELCGHIDTRDLPQCSGYGTGLKGVTPEIIKTIESAAISTETMKSQVEAEVKYQDQLSSPDGFDNK